MELKNEIQSQIIRCGKETKEEILLDILKIVAPGTHLRAGLDGALKSGRGALIAIENPHISSIIEGGFRINARFTPQRLVELCKMDGAIILSNDLKRITHANVLLAPDHRIKSSETGTRHKAAERTAKHINTLTISISERRSLITLFSGKVRYVLMDTDELLRKTNENVQILEKQRSLFERYVRKLSYMELRNLQSLEQAVQTIQKGILIQKINDDLKKNIIELGKEGVLLKTRIREIVTGVEKETDLVMKDYAKVDVKKSRALLKELSFDDLLDKKEILRCLAYENESNTEAIKGWRILSMTSLTEPDVAQVVKRAGSLGAAIHSNIFVHQEVLGMEKAEQFWNEINRIKLNA